jgi:hypothetical protein
MESKLKIKEFRVEDTFSLLKKSDKSHLHWFATGKFGLNIYLGLPLKNMDIYSVYVPYMEFERWVAYISENATEKKGLTNLRLFTDNDYSMLLRSIKEPKRRMSYDRREKLLELEKLAKKENDPTLSYEDLLTGIRDAPPDSEYSLGNNYTHLVSLDQLSYDLKRFAPRYTDNLIKKLCRK